MKSLNNSFEYHLPEYIVLDELDPEERERALYSDRGS